MVMHAALLCAVLYVLGRLCCRVWYTHTFFRSYEKRLRNLKNKTGIKVKGNGDTCGPVSLPNETERQVRERMAILRESFGFLFGGKAALAQTAHPFVADGVKTHSRITHDGVQARFYRTFYYMFRLIFGDEACTRNASLAVSRLHSNVKGKLTTELPTSSLYQKGDEYNAADAYALRWVWMTLVESNLQSYRYLFGDISKDARDKFVKGQANMLPLFGLDKGMPDTPETEEQLLEMLANGIYEDEETGKKLIVPSRAAVEIGSFLFKPAHPFLAPSMRWLQEDAACLLPGNLAREYGLGSSVSNVRFLYFCVRFSLLSVIYTALPMSVRCLTPYHYFAKRVSKEPISYATRASANVADAIIRTVLPLGETKRVSVVTGAVCCVLAPVLEAATVFGLVVLAGFGFVVSDASRVLGKTKMMRDK
eukprot:TRINITY_DN13306_c3_g1_i1.p1 TRINITY_DN13306_c3_g1~~TRINITY_DN13306_c3_g1_i1.p1  ORF type:complete len:439 (+),score=56.48 TRINITY_DN13306_c3_g1_i1:52-1317(+)